MVLECQVEFWESVGHLYFFGAVLIEFMLSFAEISNSCHGWFNIIIYFFKKFVYFILDTVEVVSYLQYTFKYSKIVAHN